MNYKVGKNCIIDDSAIIGENVTLGHNIIIEPNAKVGNNTFIDSNTIIRSNANIGDNSFIGSNCIIGEYLMDYCLDKKFHEHPLYIGDNALIRSGSILYAGSVIGNNFQTGHQVTIREKAEIGNNVSIGTLSFCCTFDILRLQRKEKICYFQKTVCILTKKTRFCANSFNGRL